MTVEYCQAYEGSDYGFEFFGGSVNIKYCVLPSCSDDSFHTKAGTKSPVPCSLSGSSGNTGVLRNRRSECDNNGTNFAVIPIAHPILANLTRLEMGGKQSRAYACVPEHKPGLPMCPPPCKKMCMTNQHSVTGEIKQVRGTVSLCTSFKCTPVQGDWLFIWVLPGGKPAFTVSH